MLPRLWNGVSNKSSGAVEVGLQRLQPSSLSRSVDAGVPSSANTDIPSSVSADVLSSGGVSQPVVMSPVNVRGSRSAPIVYRRKSKGVCGQQQSLIQDTVPVFVDASGASGFQPMQPALSNIPVVSSNLQPDLQPAHSDSPVVSSDLQPDPQPTCSVSAQSVHDASTSDSVLGSGPSCLV
ncbi:hypothetical protein V6N11_070174 [Hibiscus sabdariffa]|uniref:Uncharacterized protein n=1 Tax=Hibiscus sabdariffa TaxID=183260 RepID=A0ABR2QEB2_9ROSI